MPRDKMSWWALGPEGSGNHILQDVLCCHPFIRERKHPLKWTSLPRNRIRGDIIGHPSMGRIGQWPRMDQFKENDKILLIHRSGIHSVYSAYRRFRDITPGGVPTFVWYYLSACDFMSTFLFGPFDVQMILYEQLMADPEMTKKIIAKFFGVLYPKWDTSHLILELRNDDRWKKDKEFGSAIEPYLNLIHRRGLGCNGNLCSK